jgi:hypothetical protein
MDGGPIASTKRRGMAGVANRRIAFPRFARRESHGIDQGPLDSFSIDGYLHGPTSLIFPVIGPPADFHCLPVAIAPLVPRHRDFDRLGGEAVFVLRAVRQSGWPPGMAAIDPLRASKIGVSTSGKHEKADFGSRRRSRMSCSCSPLAGCGYFIAPVMSATGCWPEVEMRRIALAFGSSALRSTDRIVWSSYVFQ